MDDLNLNDVRVFVRVIEVGGFSAAARALRVSKSSVSRSVSRLEDHLGVRLVQRTSRAMVPTSAGRRYFEQTRAALDVVRDALASASEREEPRGLVRLSAPASVGSEVLPPLVVRFTSIHSGVEIEVALSAGTPNLIEEGIDLAIVGGPQPDSSLIARALGGSPFHVYASPDYLARRGVPRRPEELGDHDCVLFRGAPSHKTWTLEGPRGVISVSVEGRVTSNELSFVRRACASGAGVALLPRAAAAAAVARGELAPILEGYAMVSSPLYLVVSSARHLPPRVRLLRDFIVREFPAEPRS